MTIAPQQPDPANSPVDRDGNAGDAGAGSPTRSNLTRSDLLARLGDGEAVSIADAGRLSTRIKRAKPAELAKLAERLTAAERLVQRRREAVPVLRYPEDLPVSGRRADIAEAIANNQVVIVAGETGSGKTTQLPKICLELGRGVRGSIGHTQPRRIAARAVAERIAEETETEIGGAIGFSVRFSDRVSATSLVKVMTDGILLREITRDALLRNYDTIIIDEAHERSLNIDFLLGYLKSILPRRPDLKLIITSATIDPERFAKHFAAPDGSPAPIIEVSGRSFPVEIRYRPLVDPDAPNAASGRDGGADPADQVTGIVDAVAELFAEGPSGDVLVFLSGEREIRDAADALTGRFGGPGTRVEVVPLYARLSAAEQHRVFAAHSGRRIVLATNVAETSLTVPGIRYVVDTGTARISRYSVRTKVQRLPIEPVSQASARQRAGRSGRTSPGICIRLYTEADFESRPEFTDPEILRTNLASVILSMTALGLGDMAAFPFVEPPDTRAIRDGISLLEELGALGPEPTGRNRTAEPGARSLTPIGRVLADLPVDPRLGRMLAASAENGSLREVLVIVAALSIQDVRERPADQQQQAASSHARFTDPTSEFLTYLNLWNYLGEQRNNLSSSAFRKMCLREYLHYVRIREWQDLHRQLTEICGEQKWSPNKNPAGPTDVHQALLTGLLSQIGLKDADTKEVRGAPYKGSRGTTFYLFPGSALAKKPPALVMAGELVETSRLFARTVAKIEPEWAERAAGPLAKRSYSEPRWSKKRESAVATERVTLFGVPLVVARTVNFGPIDPEVSRELFIRHALVQGEWATRHSFAAHNLELLASAEYLEDKARRRDIVVDEETLFEFFDRLLPANIVSSRHFDTWFAKANRETPGLLEFRPEQLLAAGAELDPTDYPGKWRQREITLDLSYKFEPADPDDGVTVAIPVAQLAAIRPSGFDWLVPGFRIELVAALIKTLPKELRRRVVPATEFAAAALGALEPRRAPLTAGLATELSRLGGVRILPDDFDTAALPEHLRMNFVVVGDDGKLRGRSRSLGDLQRQFGASIERSLQSKSTRHTRSAAHQWTAETLGTIPATATETVGGQPITVYPSLIVGPEGVGVTVQATAAAQALEMARGTDWLLAQALPGAPKAILSVLAPAQRLSLSQGPYPDQATLLADCRRRAITELRAEFGGQPMNPNEFAALLEVVRPRLGTRLNEIVAAVGATLEQYVALDGALRGIGPNSPAADARDDVVAQRDALVFSGFIAVTGSRHLAQIPRYLRGARVRLEALPQAINRDDAGLDVLDRLYAALDRRLELLPPERRDTASESVHWQFEELRIGLFAQSLGTQGTVSEKRLRAAIDNL